MTITRRAGALGLALGLGLASAWPALADQGSDDTESQYDYGDEGQDWDHGSWDEDDSGDEWSEEDGDDEGDYGDDEGDDSGDEWSDDDGDDEGDDRDRGDHGDKWDGRDGRWGVDLWDIGWDLGWGGPGDRPVAAGFEPMTGWTPFTPWATATNTGWLGGLLGGGAFVGGIF